HARRRLHPAAGPGSGRGGLRAAPAPGLPRLPDRHDHRSLRALSHADPLAHVPGGRRERGGVVRRRRAALRAVLRRAGEPARDEDPAHWREGRKTRAVTEIETLVPRSSHPITLRLPAVVTAMNSGLPEEDS